MDNKDEIRLKTVRRVDPHVVEIVDSALRTALYSYQADTELWSKIEVEGTLMIYSREAPPHNMIIIINKLNKTNFMEPLTSSCDIQVDPPYLLFRNDKGAIYGIWFSANDNVHRISAAIRQKIDQNSQSNPQPATSVMNTTGVNMPVGVGVGGGGADIMSMLSRAHEDFESKRQEPMCIVTTASASSGDLVKPSPVRAGEASNNTTVADFFAKMGGSSGQPLSSPSSSVSLAGTTNPVLQKMFEGAAAVGGQARVTVSNPIPISGAPVQTQASSLPSSVPAASVPMSLEELEGKLKEDLHISYNKEDPNLFPKSQSQFQPQSMAPSLLSPQVFTSSNFLDRENVAMTDPCIMLSNVCTNYPSILTPGPSLGMEPQPLNGSRESLQDAPSTRSQFQPNITPLTHEQLVQAFSILLKKNDFVQQLHEAYIQALNQSLKGCL